MYSTIQHLKLHGIHGFSGFISWFIGFFMIHHVSSTQWHDQDDSHMTIRYHNASVMSRDAWIHSITFQLNCYDPCRAMNDAESIWVILCWQGIFEMFQDPGPGKWGDQSCSVRWHQALAPHFLSISSTEILWDSVRFCEILYPPGFAGRRWSSGLGSDCFPTQCLYMFMSKTYFWKFQFFLFVRTPQCSSDDLPQLSVFEAFFVSMPCCCRLDLGSVIWDRWSASRTWECTVSVMNTI